MENHFLQQKNQSVISLVLQLKKSSLYRDTCVICDRDFKFYSTKFEKKPDMCWECDPDLYDS